MNPRKQVIHTNLNGERLFCLTLRKGSPRRLEESSRLKPPTSWEIAAGSSGSLREAVRDRIAQPRGPWKRCASRSGSRTRRVAPAFQKCWRAYCRKREHGIECSAWRPPAIPASVTTTPRRQAHRAKKKKMARGWCKSLKRLKTAKGIQENPTSFFDWLPRVLSRLGWIWLILD